MTTQFNSNTFENDYIVQLLEYFIEECNCKGIDKARTIDKYATQLTSYMNGKLVERDVLFNEFKLKAQMYAYLRKLNPREFAELYDKSIKTGVHFDNLIKEAMKG